MNDQAQAVPSPEHPARREPARSTESIDAWVQAALSLGSGGLREQVAVPHPLGGYRVVTRAVGGIRR